MTTLFRNWRCKMQNCFSFCDGGSFIHSDSPERQSARMSKITNDSLIRSGAWCFIAVPMATVGVKGLISFLIETWTRPMTLMFHNVRRAMTWHDVINRSSPTPLYNYWRTLPGEFNLYYSFATDERTTTDRW